MATYTPDDLAAVRTAILRLATGQTRVSVQFSSASGSRAITYKSVDLEDLRDLEAVIDDDINGTVSSRRRTVLTRSRKGL